MNQTSERTTDNNTETVAKIYFRSLRVTQVLSLVIIVLCGLCVVTLPAFISPQNDMTLFVLCLGLGVVYFGGAIWIFAARSRLAEGRAFAVLCALIAVVLTGLPGVIYSTGLIWPWRLALCGICGVAVHLTLVFPYEDSVLKSKPAIRLLGLGLALVGFVISLLAGPAAQTVAFFVAGLGILYNLLFNLLYRLPVASTMEREQLRLIIFGGLVSFGPIVVWAPFSSFSEALSLLPYLLLTLVVFPIMAAFTLQRQRLMQTDTLLSRGLMYSLLTLLVALGFALAAAGLGLVISGWTASKTPLLTGLIFTLLALSIQPLRESMQGLVDRTFFRGNQVAQERLQTFSGELTSQVELSNILKILRQYAEAALTPDVFHIYVYDGLTDQYRAAAGADDRLTSDLRFPPSSPLVRMLERGEPIQIQNYDQLPPALRPDQARLALLSARLLAPLPGRQRLVGFLALGPRQELGPYSHSDIRFVDALCDQATLAIERAQVVVNMERRMREMNVLTLVAQGVNVTVSTDDIMELIYAQTTQIVPADDFRILLYHRDTDIYQYLFFLEDNDRVPNKENHPLAEEFSLEREVVQQHRLLLTTDYVQECQDRGIPPERNDIYSWVGVPLNAGSEAIGVMVMASRNPAVSYSPEQLNLLQAVADQAAGAIVKSRLLHETERRARQLAVLNEVTRQLTSTLELEPLLQNILRSAVEIFNCEAGSLLLVDDQTGDLVFRAATGPAAENIVNTRLASGTGAVGDAVQRRQTVILNDTRHSGVWTATIDQQTGFVTHALLVVPLLLKERVIGAIEVINKQDGTYFQHDDQSLLEAFAGQAAVAIENARLYTMTDRQLAVRVEELSVMQRIDRELNTSLDTTRAMRITLEWAMRQSNSRAGLVGIIQNEGMRVMASQGYSDELVPYQEALLPLRPFNLDEAIEQGVPVRRYLMEGLEQKGLLRSARSQLIIPIRRETSTIGLILLESQSATFGSEDALNFLVRLSDHAAIAISNAQLYAAVQAANLAKSEFVSFVSHELKNPMTSIKGYTELLAAGAVGPINDPQANFLAVIRANVERMATLVSDLADVSRIEAGRLKLDFKALTVPDMMDEVVRSLRRQLDDKGLQLSVQVPPDLPMVWGDRTRLVQILTNLVSNAHKYTPQGGQIIFSAELSQNLWDPTGAPNVVHFAVKDTGIGINPEDQKKIFQKFFRSEDPKTREAPGTGLGLNITRSLVELQGGRIWFESEYRKGSTFHFTVPAAEA